MAGPAGFGIENLPFGVARLPGGAVACVSALEGDVVDLAALARSGALAGCDLPAGVFEEGVLNRFLACGASVREGVRRRLARLVADADPRLGSALVPVADVELCLPVAVADFVDFSASLHHATRMGRLLRPGASGAAPLPAGWHHQPRGYHGRAGSVVVSGTGVVRPHGRVDASALGIGPAASALGVAAASALGVGPTAALDFEAEVGFVVGVGSRLGAPVPAGRFRDHVAGLVLVNDWSARDVQAAESQPLGPFLGKSFATSVSPWLVTLDALAPYRVDPTPQQPRPPAYLAAGAGPASAYDVRVEVALQTAAMQEAGVEPATVARCSVADLYWTLPQLLAHATVNGAALRTGDLFGSGTLSGPGPGTEGSLIELAEAGARPVALPGGTARAWLEDGDTVVLRGWAGGDGRPLLSLGEVRGTVLPAGRLEA
jgi:fumarylacetoacetase